MAYTICLLNFKGGVGKTTCAVNLGAALARLRKKTLIIDLDVQGTATSTFRKLDGDATAEQDETIYDFLAGKTTAAFAYPTETARLDFVPSSPQMRYVEMELNRKREREHILQRFVEQVSSAYDYILLDCPPGEGVVTDNAMVAADGIVIPVKCEVYSMFGLRDILVEVDDVRRHSNQRLELLGIVANEYDGRTRINREIVQALETEYPGDVFATRIRKNVALAEFSSAQQNIFDYAPTSLGAQDYAALAKEIVGKTK